MAEFCLDCFNKLHGTNYTKWDVVLSWGWICVRDVVKCCEFKRTVVVIRDKHSFLRWFFGH